MSLRILLAIRLRRLGVLPLSVPGKCGRLSSWIEVGSPWLGGEWQMVFVGIDNGWVDKETFFLWLKQVFQPTTKCSPGNRFLLFRDGHSTRYTTETIVLAKKLGCHSIVISPHATHFMGVTDKSCHGPYHVRYSRYKKLHLKDDIYRLCWNGNSVLP